jgi:hypothetical protein
MGKYFNVEVKPTIAASRQAVNSSVFGATDVLFDWTSFQIPKGAARLIGITYIVRGKNGAAQTSADLDFYFAKTISGTAPATMGLINATAAAAPVVSNHIIGMTRIDTDGGYGESGFDHFTIAKSGGGGSDQFSLPNVVLQGEPESGDNVGYDTLYIGAVVGTNGCDFGTTVLVSNAIAADNTTVIPTQATADGNDDPNAELKFAVGDVIHSATDDELGTIASIASFSTAQNITLTANNVDAIADNEEIFNINPIRIILSFEK